MRASSIKTFLLVSTLIWLASALLFLANAQASTKEDWHNLVPESMQALPEGVLKWYITETDFLSRNVDPRKIYSPHLNYQDAEYKPENKAVFDLVGLWIPAEELKYFSTSRSQNLEKRFKRVKNGRNEILFLIHPESLEIYKKWLNAGYQVEIFKAAATASSRSLLAWQPGDEKNAFIAKVSLNKEIAGVVRTLSGAETAKSIGVSETLEGATNLPKSLLLMNESFSAIPKGLLRGGMIIREFPQEMVSGNSHFVPLFALYGSKRPGYLLWALQNSQDSVETVIRQKILKPFATLWTEMALEQGILFEPHAQNILIELKNNRITGKFVLRDFGGVTIDFEYRKMRKLFVPKFLPTFSGSMEKDYSLDWYSRNIRESLHTFFEGGFLFNVQDSLTSWQKNKLISFKSFSVITAFRDELVQVLEQKSGQKINLGKDYSQLEHIVLKNRLQFPSQGERLKCNQFFKKVSLGN